jgi:hypothetical protein
MLKHLETEQHIAPWSMGHWTNEGGNQKVSEIYWKWKYNLSECMGHSKGMLKGKLIAMSAC